MPKIRRIFDVQKSDGILMSKNPTEFWCPTIRRIFAKLKSDDILSTKKNVNITSAFYWCLDFCFLILRASLMQTRGKEVHCPLWERACFPLWKRSWIPLWEWACLTTFWLGCNLCGRPFAIPGVSSIIVFCTHTFIVQLRYNFMFCLRQQVLAMVGVSNIL